MARFTVILPVVAVVDVNTSSFSHDQAIATAQAWLVLPSNAGAVVASKVIEGKAYDAPPVEAGASSNPSNTREAGTGRSVIEQILP